MKNSTPLARLRTLVSRTLDGVADEGDSAQIERLLQDHPDLVDHYASLVANDAAIELTCGKSTLDMLAADRKRPLPATAPTPPNRKKARKSQVSRQARPHTRGSALTRPDQWWRARTAWLPYAVSAAVLLVVGVWLLNRPGAYLVASEEARWADGIQREVGTPLRGQWLELEAGRVNLSFRSGAQVTVRGPARFRVTSSNRSELHEGTLVAQVPEAAKGFLVATPEVRVIDLGTSFRVNVGAEGLMDCHVTQGKVELHRPASNEKVSLAAGDIASLTDLAEPIAVAEQAGVNRTSPTVRFLAEHPASLGYKAFIHNDEICVFLESHQVRLPDDLRVNLIEVGRHDQLTGVQGKLAEGQLVDCYMVHCAPSRKRHIVEGRLEFPGKVVGMICSSDALNSTNEILGAQWTLQCRHPERGLESAPDRNSDTVTLSGDRRTLTLRLRTESIDQLRVLVATD